MEPLPEVDEQFEQKARRALKDLALRAQAAQELHFALALSPEMLGMRDLGWSAAAESARAFEQFHELAESIEPQNPNRARVILSLYAHVAEGSGFYEIPKKLLLTASGNGNNMAPFRDLADKHRLTGETISPNSNKIMKDLIGHATELGLTELAEVFRDAFNADVRNAIAHADYIIWNDGLRLPKKHGGSARIIPWDAFTQMANRGIGLFQIISDVASEFKQSYNPPKTIKSRLHTEPEGDWTIYHDPQSGVFGITSGETPPSHRARTAP